MDFISGPAGGPKRHICNPKKENTMSKPMDRRTMLKGAGFAVALPLLDAMIPSAVAFGRNSKGYKGPMRFLGTGTPLGMHPSNFHPRMATRDYELPLSLTAIEHLRKDFTVFSNLLLLFCTGLFIESGAQDFHCPGFVFMPGFLILACYNFSTG